MAGLLASLFMNTPDNYQRFPQKEKSVDRILVGAILLTANIGAAMLEMAQRKPLFG
jgi:hypothetical protein